MKALIIGFGKMGMLHAATLNQLQEIDEVIVCERSKFLRDLVNTFSDNVKSTDSWKRAIDTQSIDLAVIATPTGTHAEIYKELSKRSIPTFIEKPFAASLKQCLDAVRINSDATAPITMIGYCLRFCPSFENAKALIERGAIGTILSFDAKMLSRRDWKVEWLEI